MAFLDDIGLGSLSGNKPDYYNSIEGTTKFGTSGGTITQGNKAMIDGKIVGTYDQDTGTINSLSGSATTNTNETAGFLDNMSDLSTIAGTGLNIYSNLFGDAKAMNDKKMEALGSGIKLQNQQIKANKQAMANRNQFNTTWANASNGLGKLNA